MSEEFAFRFDQRIEPVVFGGQLKITGWLVDLAGRPINGIRANVRKRIRRKQTFRARRKRNRADVASAYPNLPDAKRSGFLLEIALPFGRSEIEFQVLDHARKWRTIERASVRAFPLALLNKIGLRHTRDLLVLVLKQLCRASAQSHAMQRSEARAEISRDNEYARRIDLFATTKSNLFIIEIGELVAAGFRELGYETSLRLDEIPEQSPPNDTLQIVVTPHEFYNLFLTRQLDRRRVRELTRNLILLCTEQPETGWFQSNLQWGIYARALADINPLGVEAYRSRGLRCHHLQLGYHPVLGPQAVVPHHERTNDIAFLGSLTERRDEFFAEHAEFFSQHRCQIRLVPLGFAKTKQTRSYLSVEQRNELLSDSKILLNVHYSDRNYFEWHRMLIGLANGCCIITETCEGFGPLRPGEHFIMVAREFLVPSCEYYLARPDECARIANAGLEFVRTHLRQSQSCAAFLAEVAEQNVETPLLPSDADAVALPRALRSKLVRHTTSLLGRAVRDDVFQRDRDGEAPAEPNANLEDAMRDGVIRKREGYRERLQAQRDAAARGEQPTRLQANVAYQSNTTPALTVLVTLYNYAQFIGECLASVEKAAAQLHEPVEVLIVNDASTDHSLGTALALQERSNLPVRVIDKKFNTGLADARNTGIHHARAPFIFVLDADNLVFPAAFVQLLAAIRSGDYAAAFSLLCRFRGTPRHRVGLLSYYDWDPQILVQYPYIDAMAMFRREALIEAGGYDTELSQVGWFGWEDYDLWLRFAHHGHKIAFVPNILCLYRHHERSMINTTNLFEVDLVNHLAAKYRELVEAFEPRDQLLGVERHRLSEFRPGETTAAR